MHFLVSVLFFRIWDELPYLGFGGLTLPVIALFLKVWSLNQQHQHHWRDRNAEYQTSLQTFWFRICILIRFPGDSRAHYDLRSTAEYPQRSVHMEAQKCTVCTEKELGEERGASQVPSLAKLWCAESYSLAQYLLSFSEFHFPFFSVSFEKLTFPGCSLEFIIYFAYFLLSIVHISRWNFSREPQNPVSNNVLSTSARKLSDCLQCLHVRIARTELLAPTASCVSCLRYP